MALPNKLDVLRSREFRLLLGGQAVSVLGDRMVTIALAFAVLEIGGSAAEVGLVLAAEVIPLVVSGVGVTLGMSVWESTLQRNIPGDSLSRVSSYDWFGSLAVAPLGVALWGPVAAAIGTSASLWLAFGIGLAAIIGLLSVPDIRRCLPVMPHATPAPPKSSSTDLPSIHHEPGR